MLLRIDKLSKSIGGKDIFEDLSLFVTGGEKIGLIGRNGMGKTTLLRILNKEDNEFSGNIEIQKGITVIATKQEHFFTTEISPLEYILENVPRFQELNTKIKTYENNGDKEVSLEEYCDALHDFSQLDYFSLENKVIQSLIDFRLNEDKIIGPMLHLSGGEKRFVELVKVMYSGADLALIDEPTNHMDYIGKQEFIEWLNNFNKTAIVITHDRDVLKHVDKVVEIKEKNAFAYNGNYEDYLKQNNFNNLTNIKQYENDMRALERAEKQMKYAKLRKHEAKVTKSRTAARIREERFVKQYEKLSNELKKPSFWIDKESLNSVSGKVEDSYSKFKERNILIQGIESEGVHKLLVAIKNLSLGYDEPLFKNLNFEIHTGERVFVKGRNGAGKSTLLKTIIALANHEDPQSKTFAGDLKISSTLKIGVYEQEINQKFLSMTLGDALVELHSENNIQLGQQKLITLLKNYLFDPEIDAKLTFDKLSGGQKARFQLIKMFVNRPNLLILDEPTNHLDLPSIEELETALHAYKGGIIFVSHDSYFINSLAGRTVDIDKQSVRKI